MSEQSRMANVQAATECDLLFVSREEFNQMVEGSHVVVKGVLRILADRLWSAQVAKK